MAVVEVSVTPLGTGSDGVSRYVSECVRIARASGLKVLLTPMGTILEGEMALIWPVLQAMEAAPFTLGVTRVSTLIKIDDRRDGRVHTLEEKVNAVEKRLA